MVLIRPWGRKLVSCRQVLALTGDSPKWVSEPCVLQMSLKQKDCLKWLSGVPTVLAGQEGVEVRIDRLQKESTPGHLSLWLEKKNQTFSTCLGGIELWTERNEGGGQNHENYICASCPQGLWRVLLSSYFLSLAPPPITLWWETKSALCLSVWVLRHSFC